MPAMSRFAVASALFLSLPALAAPRAVPAPDVRASYDALAEEGLSLQGARIARPTPSAPGLQRGQVLHIDDRLGVPTLLWAGGTLGPRAAHALQAKATTASMARAHLADWGALYHLDAEDVRTATLREVHDTGRGPLIVKFTQSVSGVPVFRDEVKVVMDRGLSLLSIAGNLTGAEITAVAGGAVSFPRGAAESMAVALSDLSGSPVDAQAFHHRLDRGAGYQLFSFAAQGGLQLSEDARTRKVLFHLPGLLEPAHYIELSAQRPGQTDTEIFSYVVSARDGRILFRNDLTANDGYTYRVWAETSGKKLPLDGPQGHVGSHPTGVPNGFQAPFTVAALTTLAASPFSKTATDPWLPAGATTLTGNNVQAYADLAAPDGFDSGSDLSVTASGATFDYTADLALSPDANVTQRSATITQLFYNTNYFHDWYYDHGFTEVAGNAQDDNFGRGGQGGDSLKAEAQDYGGRNNANMSTPADGGRPRMQMYIFDGNSPRPLLQVNSPSGVTLADSLGTAAFGPVAFDVTADLVAAVPADGCAALTNAAAIANKVALIDRGTCPFVDKVKAAQTAGAKAVVIANNVEGLLTMAGDDATITIGSLVATLADGTTLHTAVAAGAVNVTLRRVFLQARDGGLDNQIVSHEWGHMISNRLVHDGNGLTTSMARGMGEGWADFHSMLMTVRDADRANPGNAQFGGVYALASFVMGGGTNEGYYFGIRRYPYSTDLSKNPLTFHHIENYVALPPQESALSNPDYGTTGEDNSEVHNTGEIWATMLWECYAALLNDSRFTFDQAQTRMKDILVAAYKITPATPTLLEARDAVLTAAYGFDPLDYTRLLQAFAKRGAGTRAIAPDRYSTSNMGVVESYTAGQDVAIDSASLDNSVTARCGSKSTLLSGETGLLTLVLRNVGALTLDAGTATLSSTNPKVSFPTGATLTLSTLTPGQQLTVTTQVALAASATGVQALDFTLTFPGLANVAPISTVLVGNALSFPAQSASDDVESPEVAWAVAADSALFESQPWRRLALSATSHRFWASDLGYPTDLTLTSPNLAVNATGDFSFSFKHRFDLTDASSETTPIKLSGAVIEIAVVPSSGTIPEAAWKDVGTAAGYNGTVYVDTRNPGVVYAHNPLEDRPAFVGKSSTFPALTAATVNLGAVYAAKTVRVRFRLGTGYYGIGAQGWEIDDLAFNNIVGTPFAALVAAGATCASQPVAVVGQKQSVDEKAQVTLDGHASSDPDGASLSFQWTQLMGAPATLSDATTLNPTFTAPSVRLSQTLTFQLVVNNGQLSSVPALAQVDVKDTNHAPVAAPGLTLSANSGEPVTLDGSASSDADGDALTYSWKQVGAGNITLTNPTTAKPTFTAPAEAGTYEFRLIVSDDTFSSAASTFKVEVSSGGCQSFPGAGGLLQLLPLALVMLGMKRRRAGA